MNEVDKALEHADKRLDSDCRTLAAELRRLRAMLEPTPDVKDLAMALEGLFFDREVYGSESYWKRIFKASELIAAHDARLLDEAADRGLRYYENTDIAHRSGEGLYRAISGHDRAAVRWEVEK